MANDSMDSNGNQDASWWIDDSTPGVGDRPEWLPEKFKSAKDVVNSYSELEKRLGSAPQEYDFSKGESWLDPDINAFQEFADYAKSKNVSQDVMDKMLESMDGYLSEFRVDYDAEKAKLGKDADERLERLDNWARSNFSEDTYDALTSSLNNAEAILAIEEIRSKMLDGNTQVPNGNESTMNSASSMEDLQAELDENLDKYKTDPKYRRDLQRRMEYASSKGPFVDKSY